MSNNDQISLRVFGLLICVPGIMAIASMPVGWLFGEFYMTIPFLATALVSGGVGLGLYRWLKPYRLAHMRRAVVIVAAAWLGICVLSTIPYLLVANHFSNLADSSSNMSEFLDPWNAMFEATSAFTSAGLSVTKDVATLPRAMQWWRSFSQWVGGVGIVVLVLSVMDPQVNPDRLYNAEAREAQFAGTLRETTQRIWLIYLLLTAISIGLFWAAGMGLWPAINHGMTGIATGGFTITRRGFEDYGPVIKLAAIPVMLMGAISFSVYANVMRGRLSSLWSDSRYRALWLLLIVGAVLMNLEVYWDQSRWRWIDGTFQWVSALTTCGFGAVNEEDWSATARLMMIAAMVCGAVSGSTVGGLKLDRVVILWKAAVRHLRMVYRPALEHFEYSVDGEVLDEEDALRQLKSAVVPAMLWVIAIGLGCILLSHVAVSKSFLNILFETASALGTTGLSAGVVDASSSWLSKMTLVLLMWAGRLEIIPVVIMLSWLPRLFNGDWDRPGQRGQQGQDSEVAEPL
ncbi:MAG: TrkH family potassium uptake protein [Cyanobacteria bacterium P01_A01_bin.135]